MVLRTGALRVRGSTPGGPRWQAGVGWRYHPLPVGDDDPAGECFSNLEVGIVSSTARWIICTVCAIWGVIALVYAVIYLSVPIHSLPGFVPGKHDVNGHYHKRAA